MKQSPKASATQMRASDPAHSAWVNANAGSGKTHVLVDRVIRLVLAGTPPSRILCLTFTKAAAAEMSGRIFKRLAEWIGFSDERLAIELRNLGCEDTSGDLLLRARRLFAAMQETPGGLKIQTIHAFCERLLQLFPVEAGISPGFDILDNPTAKAMRDQCRDATILDAIKAPDSDAGKALASVTRLVAQDAFDSILQHLLESPEDWYKSDGPEAEIGRMIDGLADFLNVNLHQPREAITAALMPDMERYRALQTAMLESGPNDVKVAVHLDKMLASSSPTLIDAKGFLFTKDGKLRSFDKFPAKGVRDALPNISDFLRADQDRLEQALQKLGDYDSLAGTRSLLIIASKILARYELAKRTQGKYDFNDLIARTRALLTETSTSAWVLYKLDGGIDHVLIDEAQDTSPSQWAIVRALTGEFFAGEGSRPGLNRTMFAVGDRKQSIFSFQGADPQSFEQAHDEFAQRIGAFGGKLEDVDFTVSFRSTPEVLEVVDAVFGEGSPARNGLEGNAPTGIVHESNRATEHGTVELWPLIEPDEKQEPVPWLAPVDTEPGNTPSRKLARKIAETLQGWIGKRHIGDSGRVVGAGDILILVRKRDALFDAMIGELRRCGVPVAGADRLKLRDSIAVLDLLALGSFVLLAEDDYSLACVLKSPLMAVPVTEDGLFALAHGRGNASLWNRLRKSDVAAHQQAAQRLDRWLEQASRLPPFEFFASVVQETRTAIIARLGSEANDPLNAFLQAVIDFGVGRAPSLAAFLAWFQESELDIKRNMDQAHGEVRVMTVHGAKGLEAPIVILPDTTGIPEARNPSEQILDVPVGNGNRTVPLWTVPKSRPSEKMEKLKLKAKDFRMHEYNRLLYVAMTRARDELYICGRAGQHKLKDGNWYDHFKEKFLGLNGVRELPDGAGWRYGVDPRAAADAVATLSPATALPPWIDQSAAPSGQAAQASVTTLAKADDQVAVSGQAGRDRGVLIHRLLQVLPGVAVSQRSGLARQIVARAGQPEDIAETALSLLADPILEDLLAGDCLREVAISAPLADLGLTVTGRIDCLAVSGNRVTIADFKTDRNPAQSLSAVPAAYGRQMALYRKIMADAYPGREITCVLVWTAGPHVMELPSSFLEQALARVMAARP